MRDDFQTHCFSYRFDGSEWCFDIRARSAEEAQARVAQLAFAKYDGELVAEIPAVAGPLVVLGVWARNAAASIARFWRGHEQRR